MNKNNYRVFTQDDHFIEMSFKANGIEEIHEDFNIGLLNTNELYLNSSEFPTEEEHFTYYMDAINKSKDKLLTIQLYNLDSSSAPSYLFNYKEANPLLGKKGIRIFSQDPELLKIPLRAILRASAKGNIRILIPMITYPEEVAEIRVLIDELKKELTEKNIEFNKNIQVGALIETPASAFLIERFIQYAHFCAIDLDSLAQYTMALDKNSPISQSLWTEYNPAVLRLLKRIIDVTHISRKKALLFGTFTENPDNIPLLIGMGLDEFCIKKENFKKIKSISEKTIFEDSIYLADRVLSLERPETIKNFIEENLV